MEELEIPEWFFQSASLRVAWMDLLENWLYLEIKAECPNCLAIEESKWVITVEERELLKSIKCRRCGFPIGDIVLRELERFLAEVESMLKRVRGERSNPTELENRMVLTLSNEENRELQR